MRAVVVVGITIEILPLKFEINTQYNYNLKITRNLSRAISVSFPKKVSHSNRYQDHRCTLVSEKHMHTRNIGSNRKYWYMGEKWRELGCLLARYPGPWPRLSQNPAAFDTRKTRPISRRSYAIVDVERAWWAHEARKGARSRITRVASFSKAPVPLGRDSRP